MNILDSGPPSGSTSYLLQVDIGADQDVIEEKDLSLLRLENLTFITVNNFNQEFTMNQLPLLRVQQLETQTH